MVEVVGENRERKMRLGHKVGRDSSGCIWTISCFCGLFKALSVEQVMSNYEIVALS